MKVTKECNVHISMREKEATSLLLILGHMSYADIKLALEKNDCYHYKYSDYENTEKLWRELSNALSD